MNEESIENIRQRNK